MLRNINKIIIISFLSLFILVFTSCKNEEEKEAENYFSAKNNTYCEHVFLDIFKWVNNAQLMMEDSLFKTSKSSKSFQAELNNAISISYTPMDTTTWPKMLTINFGHNNIICLDGKKRKGKISAAITGRFHKQGTAITIIPSNFYINDFYAEGTIKIICAGKNKADNFLYREDIKQAKVVSPDGTIYWSAEKNIELINGYDTPYPYLYDDMYKITGTSWGTDVTGKLYKAEIIDPLMYSINCKWIKEGTEEITPESLSARSLDYGNDGCNPYVKVTILDKTFNFIINW